LEQVTGKQAKLATTGQSFETVSRSVLLGLPQQEQAGGKKWTYVSVGLAVLIAMSASVTHPENLLAIGAVFAIFGIGSDSGRTNAGGDLELIFEQIGMDLIFFTPPPRDDGTSWALASPERH
jgi:hypothetical protein